jgi:hypothetical protein
MSGLTVPFRFNRLRPKLSRAAGRDLFLGFRCRPFALPLWSFAKGFSVAWSAVLLKPPRYVQQLPVEPPQPQKPARHPAEIRARHWRLHLPIDYPLPTQDHLRHSEGLLAALVVRPKRHYAIDP